MAVGKTPPFMAAAFVGNQRTATPAVVFLKQACGHRRPTADARSRQ